MSLVISPYQHITNYRTFQSKQTTDVIRFSFDHHQLHQLAGTSATLETKNAQWLNTAGPCSPLALPEMLFTLLRSCHPCLLRARATNNMSIF
ncbi:hypothetical protein XF_1636 [Xylella fastidiosa 9a5c]|uniref:Uncharacterized protein n=1 Tax=Xylella fastidiosa (strain 9a5c) TaxID=160492 RepID=Q9PCW8_XYLFA|nr:hypothetical protein XF_1636 [Xylella fastidiosa 9a5c]